jgi:hypothetical protein
MKTRTGIGFAMCMLSLATVSTTAVIGCNSGATHRGDGKPATAAAPVPPPAQPAPTGRTEYVDPARRFRFEHPSELAVSTGSAEPAPGWRAGTTTNGVMLAQIVIPREAQPNTNLADAKFTVGKSADPAAVRDCTRDAPGEQVSTTTLTLHGRTFTQLVFHEAAAGNFYETTSYRTVEKGECVAVEYTIHSTNLDNYAPDQHVAAFDRAKIGAELEAMARSFELP